MKQEKNLLTGIAVIGLLTFATCTNYAADSTNEVTSSTNVMAAPTNVMAPPANEMAPAPAMAPASEFNPFTVGAEVGTTGYGGAAGWRFMDHFGVDGGFDYFSYSLNNRNIQDASYSGNLRLQSEPLTLDLYPSRFSSFHLGLGALFNQDEVSASANNVTVNTYTGNLNLNIKYQPVDPYVGIGGNLYFDRGHHVSLSGTLGVAYFGDSKVNLTSTPVDPTGSVANEQSKIQKYANDLKFFPIIKIGLNYSF
jgi:hypothetical protein